MNQTDQDDEIVTGTELQVIDPDTISKLDQIEMEYDELKTDLIQRTEKYADTIDKLTDFAHQAQHHMVYQALAAIIKADNEAFKEVNAIIRNKQQLLMDSNKLKGPQGPTPAVTHNHLTLTTTAAIDMIRKKNGLQGDE